MYLLLISHNIVFAVNVYEQLQFCYNGIYNFDLIGLKNYLKVLVKFIMKQALNNNSICSMNFVGSSSMASACAGSLALMDAGEKQF